MSDILFGLLEKSDLRTMRIAVVTATPMEMEPIRAYLAERLFLRSRHRFDLWVSGVGMLHTAHALMSYMTRDKPELVIQAGIAGGFHPLRHPIGTCVAVGREIQGDLGVLETPSTWKDLAAMGLLDPDTAPYHAGFLQNPHTELLSLTGLPIVNGVTVNQVTTEPARVTTLAHVFDADAESMEGAAVHYVCLQEHVPFLQLRGISNFVGDRDKSRWQVAAALTAVRNALFLTIDRIHENRP